MKEYRHRIARWGTTFVRHTILHRAKIELFLVQMFAKFTRKSTAAAHIELNILNWMTISHTHTQPKHCQHCPGPSHATYSWICTEAASIDHRTIMLIWQTLDFRLLRILMFAMAAADCIVYARISVLSWIKCVYVLYRCVDVCRWEWMNLSPNENGFQLAAFNGYYIILNGWRWWWWWWWWWKVETEVFVRTCSSFVRSTKRS